MKKRPHAPLVPLALFMAHHRWRIIPIFAIIVIGLLVFGALSGCSFWKGASEKATSAAAATVPGGSLVTAAVKAARKPENDFGKIERMVWDCVEDRDDDVDFREAYPDPLDQCRRCWHILAGAKKVMDYEEDRERVCRPKY